MGKIIEHINTLVWGAPALVMILGVGLYLTWRLRFAQFLLFPEALKRFLRQLFPGSKENRDSSFQALCTALAATVGTGNLVGVAGAICLGGPGAVFWMWICGFLGMITKYAEAMLAIRYRVKTPEGFTGGPMYMITRGLPGRFPILAYLYALFGVIASFGVGNVTQINAAITVIHEVFAVIGWNTGLTADLILALLFASVIGIFLLGGAKRIYGAAEQLVPFAALAYILLCAGVLCLRWQNLPRAVCQIFQGAFSPKAVTGGMIGSAFCALRIGCSRGVFTNEAGMGTASMAHAGADVAHPAQQGLMGIMEVFLDTIVICTLTALVILVSGVPIPYGVDAGGQLTTQAFSAIYGKGAVLWLAVVMTLFAVATVIGWGLYGTRCAEFLFGSKACRYFTASQILVIAVGTFLETSLVWQLAEAVNGLMAIPNLITLAVLTPEVCRLTKEYKNPAKQVPVEVNYANFHQCKPLRTLSYEKVPPSGRGCQERG